VLLKAGDEVGVVVGAGAAFGDVDGSGEVAIAGGDDAGGVGDVGKDDGDLNALKFSGSDGFGDGKKVGAASGEEDS